MFGRCSRFVTGVSLLAGVGLLSGGCDPAYPNLVAASIEDDGSLGIHIAICGRELVESVAVYESWEARRNGADPLWRVFATSPTQTRHLLAKEPLPDGMYQTNGDEQLAIPGGEFMVVVCYSNIDYTERAYFDSGALRPGEIRADGHNFDADEFDAWESDVCGSSDGAGLPGWVGLVFLMGLGGITAVTAVVTNRRYEERRRRALAAAGGDFERATEADAERHEG